MTRQNPKGKLSVTKVRGMGEGRGRLKVGSIFQSKRAVLSSTISLKKFPSLKILDFLRIQTDDRLSVRKSTGTLATICGGGGRVMHTSPTFRRYERKILIIHETSRKILEIPVCCQNSDI